MHRYCTYTPGLDVRLLATVDSNHGRLSFVTAKDGSSRGWHFRDSLSTLPLVAQSILGFLIALCQRDHTKPTLKSSSLSLMEAVPSEPRVTVPRGCSWLIVSRLIWTRSSFTNA